MSRFTTGAKRLVGVLTAVLLVLMIVFSGFMLEEKAEAEIPGIVVTSPADGTAVVPEVNDYAMEHFSDPWDMSQITDVAGGGTHKYGISNFNVGSGTLSGITNTNDSSFFLVHPATFESIPTGKDGLINPINTSEYDSISVRMYASEFTFIQIYWFYNQVWTDFGVTSYGIPAGWGTYEIPLSSNPDWTGNPIGLRFDPASAANVSFIIDWVKLKRSETDDNKVTIQWTDSNINSYVSLWVDEDSTPQSGNEDYITYMKSNPTNTYQMDVSRYAPGTYYFYFQKSGNTTTPVSFEVSQLPLPVITDPDNQGGQDFATVYGDPWDMSQVSDIAASSNVTGLGSNGTFVGGVSTNNDPTLYLRLPTSINTSIYHRLTFRFTYDGSFDLQDGTMTRFIWGQSGMNPYTFQTSEDIVTYPMWWTYTIDLKQSALEGGSIGWNGYVNVMRFDPLETITNRYFALDYVKLCADDEATTVFPIKWEENKNAPLPTTVSLYYDNNNSGYNGTLIASGINQQSGTNTYNWDTRPALAGLQYVYIDSSDGIGSNKNYSTGPVRIQALSYAPVNPVKTWTPSFSGKKGGPLEVRTNQQSVVSQRVHYYDSFNETEGIPESKLSTHFIFPWYDNKSGGMQNWLLVTNTNGSTATVNVSLGGESLVSGQQILPYKTWATSFAGQMDGPLEVTSNIPVGASQRVHLFNSFNEIIGIPESQLSTNIVFPWYDQLNPNMKNWLIVTNPNDSAATVSVALKGETLASDIEVPAKSSWTPSFSQKYGGPLRVTSDIPIAASQRVHYYNTNFNEVAGVPATSLSTNYTFPWYDQKSSGMSDWVIVANAGESAAQVSIKREGNTIATQTVQPNQTWTPSFSGIYGGPFQVSSDQPVAVSQRVHYRTSFNEFMGIAQSDYSTHWIFPWYDQVSAGMKDWVMIANPSTQNTISNATVKREGCY